MTPDMALELSVEQLISALSKKLLMECARVRPPTTQISRALVATLSAEADILEKQARDVLREVATLRNSLQPVNRFPPEVLTTCATFVSCTDPRPIVSLTHVCRYWRKAITSNPRNWASISTSWKSLAPLCLERAGAVPLAVDILVPDIKNSEDFANSLLPHASRVGHLCLIGFSSIDTVTNDLPGFFDAPMPNISSLELQQTEEPVGLFLSAEAPAPPVFQNISRLKSLSLTRTPLHPTLFSIPSLRELKLLGYTSPFDFGTLMGFLRFNISLESLVLDVRFDANSVEAALGGPKVPLTRLRDISITCSKAIDSRGLLSCISLPHGIRLEVTSTLADPSAELHWFLPSPLTPLLGSLGTITTAKSQVTPQELRMVGNSSTFTFRSTKISTKHAESEFTLFPVAEVRELHMDIQPFQFTDKGIITVLRALPALEILAISRTPFPSGLLSGLSAEPVLCPTLKTIAFLDCGVDAAVIKRLEEAIAKRKNNTGAQLFRVTIVSSAKTLPDFASIQELRKSVPCVEVRVDDKFPDLT